MGEFQTEGQAVPKPEGHIGPKVSQGPEGHIGPKIVNFGNQKKKDTKSVPLSIFITNNDSKQLNWSTSIPAGTNWLTLNKHSGKVAPGSKDTITASAQTGSLGEGPHTVDLIFKLTEGNSLPDEEITISVNIQ
jgi:Viral BACON domain